MLKNIVTAAFFCAFTACSVGPDYVPPAVKLPKAWVRTFEQQTTPPDSSFTDYWTRLEDPTLNVLVAKAQKDNLSLQGALLRIEELLALYRVERSQFLPDLDLTANLSKRRRSESVASALSDPNNDLFALGGAISWEIDLLGRVRRLTESASAQADASVEAYRGTMVTLLAQLAQSYVRYRVRQAEVQLTEKNIKAQRESLAVAQDRFRAGVAPELDVRQAESNLGQTEATLPVVRIQLAQERNALAVLLGGYPEDVQPLLLSQQPIPQIPSFEIESLPVNVIRQRPDIRQAERRLAAQHALIGATEAELYPIVSLPGQFSFEALNTLEDAVRSNSLAYSIGPSVRWNFLDFGATRGKIAAADLRTQQLASEYRSAVLQAVREVEDAIVVLREQKIRAASLHTSVDSSRKATELVKSLYVSGLTDFQNVLDSERRLFELEFDLAETRGFVVDAYISLFRSLGGGWQYYPDSLDSDSSLN